jgi:hypothetical protein
MSDDSKRGRRGLVAVITAAFALLAAQAVAANAGFEEVKISDGAEAPLTIGIWYPTNAPATEHPLVDITQTVATAGEKNHCVGVGQAHRCCV